MAVRDLYLGGAASTNADRSMFPAPTFNAAAEPFLSMRASRHKGPSLYTLNRILDFRDDPALVHFKTNTTVAQGDDLGILVLPADHLLLGVHFKVHRAAGVAMTLTPTLRVNTGAFPTVNGNAVAASWGQAAVTPNISATGSAATIVPWYIATPEIISLDLTTWTSFGVLRLEVAAVVIELSNGQY